ncbi:DUF4199 domain-containing protein [Psychroflexus tropicus]|uniref:DUF4199 domain-containing protein n=1 Tax=Psychroflexus tropicus TaxID=197345 RepID=UPI00035DE779|nr:DUF4199 domain-containing protein [Psychroflexus tropicus]
MKLKVEIKWALIFILSLLLWMLLERLLGLHDEYIDLHQYITMLYAIVAIVIYVLALKDKRKSAYSESASYSQLFKSGLIITLIITAFSPLSQYIISEVITPDYFTNIITHSVESGYYESVEQAKAEFNLENYILTSTIWAFVMGLATTAIVSIFLKNKK